MLLFLMRVAEAEKQSVLNPNDFSRPLTENGEQITEHAGDCLRDLVHPGFDYIVSSGQTRSRDSAEIIAGATRFVRRPIVEDVLDGDYPPEIIAPKLKKFLDCQRCLVIADAPTTDALLTYLVTKDHTCRISMEPGSIAKIETDNLHLSNGILHWLAPGFLW